LRLYLKFLKIIPMDDGKIKPAHYKAGPMDVIAFCDHHEVNFTRGTAIKYLVRAGKKPEEPELDDLHKAREFIDREIANVERRLKLAGK
jgi:hypothetical protein